MDDIPNIIPILEVSFDISKQSWVIKSHTTLDDSMLVALDLSIREHMQLRIKDETSNS